VDAVVVGQMSSQWGERVAAVVQPVDAGDSPTLSELADHCRSHLAGYKVPRHLVIVSEVPRSASGKADYGWAGALVRNDNWKED
jgi:acyl-CoA synthetase (AMP-forming)/AMP-acid ligase II